MNILTDTQTLRRVCRSPLASAALAAMVVLLGTAGGAYADLGDHVLPCVQDASGQPTLNCTANDMAIAGMTVTNIIGNCRNDPSGNWGFDGTITVAADTTTRYDLGFYIGSDGVQALTGSACWVDMIENPPEAGDTWFDEDLDGCGDHPKNVPVTLGLHGVTVKCADVNQDGDADIPVCVSYDNNAGLNCYTETDAVPANDAKCQCFTVNTGVHIGCETNADCVADQNVCTDAVCLGVGQPGTNILGCAQVNNTAPCDDGIFCNGTDVCAAGDCSHSGDPCGGGKCEACNEAADNCFVAAGTPCRIVAGVCDVAENCTGSSTACPGDTFLPTSTACRASGGVCDVAENCTGTSAACPGNTFLPTSTTCRSSGGVCDVAENCTGTSAACPGDTFLPTSTTCRSSGGVCDVAENCTGTSAACPGNTFLPTSTTCRTSGGVCDVAENCTGTSAACPDNTFLPTSTTCRTSGGVCDVAENCTGTSAACPENTFLPTSTTCRTSGGVCDVAENCTGTSAACPTNTFQPTSLICRSSAGICDEVENCTGTSAPCPGDGKKPDGTSCDEGLFCTDNVCTSGDCITTPHDCNDDDPCTDDWCNEDADMCVDDYICINDICRSPGYWATHSGYEQKKHATINVGQMLLDLEGPLEVCGQSISETANAASPWLAGLGLTSDLQGLCMRTKGVHQRQLYRQLVAAALNCAASGHANDCDTVVLKYIDVKFSDCSDLCAGDPPLVNPPTLGQCVGQLDCFNNGGHLVDGKCATGTCASQSEIACGGEAGDCPDYAGLPQACVPFEGNCHSAAMCNEDINFCPKNTPASSPGACQEARFDSCTIDSCK